MKDSTLITKETKIKVSGDGIQGDIEIVIDNLKAIDVPEHIEFFKNPNGTFNVKLHDLCLVDKTTGVPVIYGTMIIPNMVAKVDKETCFPIPFLI